MFYFLTVYFFYYIDQNNNLEYAFIDPLNQVEGLLFTINFAYSINDIVYKKLKRSTSANTWIFRYTPSVLKYKMFKVCEANVSRHVLVYIFVWTYTLKDV
jgi:hypothetical protein